MKDKETVTIDGVDYQYDSYYDRLERPEHDGSVQHPAIACPKCQRTTFCITYGNYQCIANCQCGHSMTIYDG